MSLHCHHDRGTPARVSTERVTLSIDGMSVTVPAGTSILHAAAEAGIDIPKLCATESLEAFGSCRLCVVQVKNRRGYPASCTTLAEEGMEVTTQSERLLNYRRMVIEMLFAEGNHVCSVCVSNGHCDLQNAATALGIDHIPLPYIYPKRAVDASHPLFGLDRNRCILCTRCVRVCD